MSIVGLDPVSGVERRRLSTEKALDNGHHHRCYRNKATEQYLMTSYRGVEFVDWASGDVDRNHWVRGTCRYGVMPCNGLLYSTPHPCDCYITSKLNGFYALAPAGRTQTDSDRTSRSEICGSSRARPTMQRSSRLRTLTRSASAAWPTYRHDAARTGCADGAAPTNLKVAWQDDAARRADQRAGGGRGQGAGGLRRRPYRTRLGRRSGATSSGATWPQDAWTLRRRSGKGGPSSVVAAAGCIACGCRTAP